MRPAWLLWLAATPALLGTPALAASGDTRRFELCAGLAEGNPGRAIAVAQAWRIEGGGILARHCLAIAQFQAGDYTNALESFAAAARDAARAPDTRADAARLWLAGANAGLMAGRPAAVAVMVDEALALPPADGLAAELMLLKAEALVDLGRESDALPVIEAALGRDAGVPNGWLLKATLARRLGRLAEAEAAVLEAARRTGTETPEMAEVQFEAGAIAQAQGKPELARAAWGAAANGDPQQPAVKAAAAALARLAESGQPQP